MRSPFLFAVGLTAVVACAPVRPAAPPAAAAPEPVVPDAVTVGERFVTEENVADELDSPATWTAEDGRAQVIVTAKSTHPLVVFDGDSGERLRDVGEKGEAAGRFERPGGIAVQGDLAFVVDRDNHRVQVLSLPTLTPVATFGESDLRAPYGIWANESEPGDLDVYVTDGSVSEAKFDHVPSVAEPGARLKRFRVQEDGDGAVHARLLGAFADAREAGALHGAGSIAGDPANNRLLIADADTHPSMSTLREYTLDGHDTGGGAAAGAFAAHAAGVALWDCPGGDGYWIAADPLAPLAVFHVVDRRTLAPRGSFRGRVTSHTRGIALHAAGTPSFPGGVLYAVHDDRAIAAFDLRDIASALHLDEQCVR
ncbi:phytase [Cognatilysobacter lacus]|uniref:Phytase n=1 Tax=Cognatilysobacter lacus TaxID=1643323 RepID=A0A5D8Z9Y7_9GAMM|nr:phytase [Lysobacter lacus]TZF91745.1 phytase [Lysobacter lacus]